MIIKRKNGKFDYLKNAKAKEIEQTVDGLEQENASLLFSNATQDGKINDLENENASILLELAMVKGGVV